MGEKTNAYRILVGKPEGNGPLGRLRRKQLNNTKMNLHEIESCGLDWTDLAQDRDRLRAFVNVVMKLEVPGSTGRA
jgi:hypothetical protein